MINANHKDIIRQILYNPKRFIAIFLIVALGVAFFSGVRATCPDMRLTLDQYYSEYDASDIHLLSTLGFDSEDMDMIRHIDGIQTVMPSYSVDGFIRNNDTPLLIKFQSLDMNSLQNNPDAALNKPVIVEGDYPQSSEECLVDEKLKTYKNFKVGDQITIQNDDYSDISSSIENMQYTISGFVRSLEYISFQRGSSSKGNGSLDGFIYLPIDNFKSKVYTDVYLKTTEGGSRFSDTYKDALQTVCDRIANCGSVRNPERYEKLKSDASIALDDARQKIAKGEQQLTDTEKTLKDREEQLQKGEKELAEEKAEYNSRITQGQEQLQKAKENLDSSQAVLNQKTQELSESKSKLEQGYAELEKNKDQIDKGMYQLQQMKSQIDQLSAQLKQLPADSPLAANLNLQLNSLQKTYQENEAIIDASQNAYTAAVGQLNRNKKAIESAESVLEKNLNEYTVGNKEYQKKLSNFMQQRESGATKLSQAKEELDNSRQKLDDANHQYLMDKPDMLNQIDQAKSTVTEGEKKLNNLQEPEWYTLDLSKNTGFEGYKQDTARVAAIGLVFPLIFFLVAALVSLTNMTRMVEDDRTNIGVYKALGYGRMAIAFKYLIYAGTAAIGGIVFGILIGGKLFPWVIYHAYGILYKLPPLLMPINAVSSLQAGLGALACAVIPAFLVCQKELMSSPASLMRPRTPKEGKRILLERIQFVWKHLNFSKKVTCRNIFRYKKRLIMTVLGIAGCTALIFTGFGLKESIQRMVPIQYDQIQKYDMLLNLKDDNSSDDNLNLEENLNTNSNVSNYLLFHQQTVDVLTNNQTCNAILTVPLDENKFTDFISLRNRTSGQKITLSDKGVILSEKMSRMLGVKKGDTVELRNADNKTTNAVVDDITENYIYHYVYMTPSVFEQLYGMNPSLNAVYGRLNDTSDEAENQISSTLLETNTVNTISFNTAIRSHFTDMIKALNIVVMVLILSAAALAFVVLFSLTSINIDERKRELATLKVLGFYNGETEMYLYRENIILTLFGIFVGLILGYFLLSYVLTTAEVDMVMFTRQTSWLIYLISAMLTFLFAAIVNLLMNRTIRRIDMVESLKSIE